MDTPGEWRAGVKTVSYYATKLEGEVSSTQKIINPWLMALQVDMLTNSIQRSAMDMSLLYISLDALGQILLWIIKENPKLFRNKALNEAFVACFHAISIASQLPDRIQEKAGLSLEEEEAWSVFLTLAAVLCQFRTDPVMQIQVTQGILTVAEKRLWLYRLQHPDLVGILFKNTHGDSEQLRAVTFKVLLEAVKAGGHYYIENRLLSNSITHVYPVYPDTRESIESLILASLGISYSVCDWKSASYIEEKQRLSRLSSSILSDSLAAKLKTLVASF